MIIAIIFLKPIANLDQFKPRFVFENVVGMLSAKPNGVPVAEEISNAFSSLGYYSGEINKSMVYNFADLVDHKIAAELLYLEYGLTLVQPKPR